MIPSILQIKTKGWLEYYVACSRFFFLIRENAKIPIPAATGNIRN
jgi:hypothetical protein